MVERSIRELFWRPRMDDWSPLAKFYHANETLNKITSELESFDTRRDPDRCNRLVNKMRHAQEKVLQYIEEMQLIVWPRECDRAPRDYRVKFPDDILHDNLPGQLWFGAECLAGGSNIIDHEFESEEIRPLARALIRSLDRLRDMLKDQATKNPGVYPDKLRRHLRNFDYVLAEFELNYVSAMVPVKTPREYEQQLEVAVLFSETLTRAVSDGILTQDMIDECDPSVIVTLPRLAIICGLLIFPDGPLNVDRATEDIPLMFRTYHQLLMKIRDLLRILDEKELHSLQRFLNSNEELPSPSTNPQVKVTTYSEYCSRKQSSGTRTTSSTDGVDDNNSTVTERRASDAVNVPPPGANDTTTMSTDRRDQLTPVPSPNQMRPDDTELLLESGILSPRSPSPPTHAAPPIPHSTNLNTSSSDNHLSTDKSTTLNKSANTTNNPSIMHRSKSDLQPMLGQPEEKPKKRVISKREAHIRAKFQSSEDLVHRLFVCIAGVADQLQVNNPSDIRSILKLVLQSNDVVDVYEENGRPSVQTGSEEETASEARETPPSPMSPVSSTVPFATITPGVVRWVPDAECEACTSCGSAFTWKRRRHHCRNCGRIFCAQCSGNSTAIPELGYEQRVRVCNQCFMFRVNPFADGGVPSRTSSVSNEGSNTNSAGNSPTHNLNGGDGVDMPDDSDTQQTQVISNVTADRNKHATDSTNRPRAAPTPTNTSTSQQCM